MRKFLVIGFSMIVSSSALAAPTLMKGSPVCESLNSLYQAEAILSANNEYLELPGDCLKAPRNLRLASVDMDYGGGAARVTVRSEGSTLTLWTTKYSIR